MPARIILFPPQGVRRETPWMATVATEDRRIDLARAADFELGTARARPSLLEINIGGRSEALEPRMMQMLVALHRARAAPVSRDELIELCWGGLAVSDDAITQCVSKLRRSLTNVVGVRIEAVPRVGYRLICSAERAAKTAAPAGWTRPAVAVVMLIASVSPLSFDSMSVVANHRRSASDAIYPAASPQSIEADRLHEVATRLFREGTRPGYAEAEMLLRRAVTTDPQHAPSWARLAMAVYAPFWWKEKDDPGARARLRSEGISYARRALSIDPHLAEAHQAIGFILGHDGGVKWLQRAASLDPGDPEIRVELANMLENGLELHSANAELVRAMQLEPTSPQTVFAAAHMRDRLGHRAEADAIINDFERVTQRASDARRFRFELAFERGELATAAGLTTHSLDMGDEDHWWRQFRLFDIATGLNDSELRAHLLHVQPRLHAIDYGDAAYAVKLARTRPGDWWANPVIGGLARQLIMTRNERLLLALYDERFQNTGDVWKEYGDWADCLAPPLIVAMRRSGRAAESVELRNHFAADIDKLSSEGDASAYLLAWRAQLAALDGNADLAAHWLDAAVTAGWKGQAPYRLGFDPDRDPVMALVRADRRVQRSIAHFHASVAAEAAALQKLDLLSLPWARTVKASSSG
jgi:DNA-binding winged helix-turn-helix (wHTH) protein/Tfp pilus assembly protein PilF